MPANRDPGPGPRQAREVEAKVKRILASDHPAGEKAREIEFLIGEQHQLYGYITHSLERARESYRHAVDQAREWLAEAHAGTEAAMRAWHAYEASLGGPEALRLEMLRTAGTLPRGEVPGFVGTGWQFGPGNAPVLIRPPPFADPAREAAIREYEASERARAAEWGKKEARTREKLKRDFHDGGVAIERAAARVKPAEQQAEAAVRNAQRTLF